MSNHVFSGFELAIDTISRISLVAELWARTRRSASVRSHVAPFVRHVSPMALLF